MAKKKQPSTPQKELFAVMVISILLGLGGGYALGATQNDAATSANSVADTEEKMSHSHGTYNVDAEQAPKVELVVTEDAKSGYNVKIIATDFTFTPESVNEENATGEGHAHLYIDDVKVGRLYSPYYHYDGSFEGTKTFRVTLNSNDHSEYAVDGDVIEAEMQVTHDSSNNGHAESHGNAEKSEDTTRMDGDDHSGVTR